MDGVLWQGCVGRIVTWMFRLVLNISCVRDDNSYMSDGTDLRTLVSDLAELLDSGKERAQAGIVRDALRGPKEILDEFLVSNELWGGSGSIADQAFVDDKERRRRLEELLIRVGTLQLDAGRINTRTKMWVDAFEHWKQSGLR